MLHQPDTQLPRTTSSSKETVAGHMQNKMKAALAACICSCLLPFNAVHMIVRSAPQAHRNLILIEDNVVGEPNVVHPGHGLPSLDGHAGGVKDQASTVGTKLHCGCVGSKCEGQGGHADSSGLRETLHVLLEGGDGCCPGRRPGLPLDRDCQPAACECGLHGAERGSLGSLWWLFLMKVS